MGSKSLELPCTQHVRFHPESDLIPARRDPTFGFNVPTACPDVPAGSLDPRATWPDPEAYDRAARRLARMFHDNFASYADGVGEAVRAAGPRIE